MKKSNCYSVAAIVMVCLSLFISGCADKQATFKKRIETEFSAKVTKLVEALQSPKAKEIAERITKAGASMREVEKEYAEATKNKAGADKLDPLVSKYAGLLKDSYVDAKELYELEKDGLEALQTILSQMARESPTALEANADVIKATMQPFAEINQPLMLVLQRTERAFLLGDRWELDKVDDKKLEELASQVLAHFAEHGEKAE